MMIYLILLPIFLSSMIYGIVGFGDALILIPIVSPIIGIKNAVILVNLWGTFPALLNFIKYRQYLDKGYFYRFLSLGVPATILATYLIIGICFEWIELIFGIFVFSYSSIKLIQYLINRSYLNETKILEEVQDVSINHSSALIILGGASYGLLTGLISAAGPINVALLEKTGHYRERFIENFGAIGTVLSVSRIPFYFLKDGIFPYDLLLVFIFAFPIIFVGTKIGQKITPKIPVKKFQIIIFCFLIIVGLKSIKTSIFSLVLTSK